MIYKKFWTFVLVLSVLLFFFSLADFFPPYDIINMFALWFQILYWGFAIIDTFLYGVLIFVSYKKIVGEKK